jgi:hypothetical protein
MGTDIAETPADSICRVGKYYISVLKIQAAGYSLNG